jgi:hypothetical protein
VEESMTAIYGERLTFGQENGPDVEMIVFGDEYYARYETENGYPVLYDDALGLFTYALLDDGRFFSSGVPISQAPPLEAQQHAQESDPVRHAKVAAKLAARTPPDESSHAEP